MLPVSILQRFVLVTAARRARSARVIGALSFSAGSDNGPKKIEGEASKAEPDPATFGRGIRLVPHSASMKVWQNLVAGASQAVKAQRKEKNPKIVYVASSSAHQSYLFGDKNEGTDKVDKTRERVLQLLQGE